ncbi:MAG: DAK2 domain-containing protein, partial [Actinobacteria bacterium]
FLYCTEFLLFGEDIDRESVGDYLTAVGGSELIVGDAGQYKLHVHTNDPGSVLAHVTALGEVAEVHVNNMRRQKAVRDAGLAAESPNEPPKHVGFVAVAVGDGFAEILRSLGADVIVNGGQTMNPSTKDIAEAISQVNAEKVVVLPNNKNIQMAAQAAASVSDRVVAVVPTRSVPQGFAALLAFDGEAEFDEAVAVMTEAAAAVHTGEVTTAVKDAKSKAGDIATGQIIGIVDDEEIEAVGGDVAAVALELARVLAADGVVDTLTLFAGQDFTDEQLVELGTRIAEALPELEIESHRGEQPLYPVVMSAE